MKNRISLTLPALVYVLLILKRCHASSDEIESRFIQSDEEPGIPLPADDKYNFVGEEDPTQVPTESSSFARSGSSFAPPGPTRISTGSYSVRPSGSDEKDSPFVVQSEGNFHKPGGSYRPQGNGGSGTVFVNNNCFGPRCPQTHQQQQQPSSNSDNDEWKSYHYVLNKGVNLKQRRLHSRNSEPRSRRNHIESGEYTHKTSLSIPFVVDPAVSPGKVPSNSFNRRFLQVASSTHRPSSSTPEWIKLEPILPDEYDPFLLKFNRSKHHKKGVWPKPQSTFANRVGVELDPDSFAERWGWGDKGDGDGGGSRYPAWLDQDNRNNHPTRDPDSRQWVKLEPIPVAGVTISKWVPKGTPNNDLPSTNWPSRDPVHSGNGIGHSQPNFPSGTKWWDLIDNINRLQQNQGSNNFDAPPRGWSPTKVQGGSSSSQSSWDRDRYPQNSWTDVIYPNGPSSATVSWQQDKDMSKYASSFPTSSNNNNNWKRPSPATGSWTAQDSYGGNRRHDSYPDRNGENDPRWVMVSNSRKVSVTSNPDNRRPPFPEGLKYRPAFDFPFQDYGGYRKGKNYKDLTRITNLTVSRPAMMDQDEIFRKVNATLASLTPVLSQTKGQQGLRNATTTRKSRIPAFLKPFFGDDARSLMPNKIKAQNQDPIMASASASTAVSTQQLQGNRARKGLSINPVYAAVGAGMIPATMAAIVPMVLGRRKRDLRFSGSEQYFPTTELVPSSSRIFLRFAKPRRKRESSSLESPLELYLTLPVGH